MTPEIAFGERRYFFGNRFVYLVLSQRQHGLCVGINLNPNRNCNFNCIYCEINRRRPKENPAVDVPLLAKEFIKTIEFTQKNDIHKINSFKKIPPDLSRLKAVSISGDGEPTLCQRFPDAVREVVHVRATAQFPFFKITLYTNGSELLTPHVQRGLQWFTDEDEIWVKLDVGSQEDMNSINRARIPLKRILLNILALGRQRPIVIQSLFPLIKDNEPSQAQIDRYVACLNQLKQEGAQISMVQVYSAHRPAAASDIGHASLNCLSKIAHQVKEETGLNAEVF